MKAASVVSLAVVIVAACDRIAPGEATRTAMAETFARIALYAQTNQAIPQSLQALPRRSGYANKTTDGWGRPLQYDLSKEGVITLRSYGADGKPGGVGEDADISVSYHSKRPDGGLWAGSPLWLAEAKLHAQEGETNENQMTHPATNSE